MAASRIPLVVVLGSTGAGKSKLAIEIAKVFKGEIISADSMQIYKGLDIITNKVTEEEQAEAPHHLISYLEPDRKHYNVVDFRDASLPIIDDLISRSIMPVVVGGTNYYIESILWDFLINKTEPQKTVRPISPTQMDTETETASRTNSLNSLRKSELREACKECSEFRVPDQLGETRVYASKKLKLDTSSCTATQAVAETGAAVPSQHDTLQWRDACKTTIPPTSSSSISSHPLKCPSSSSSSSCLSPSYLSSSSSSSSSKLPSSKRPANHTESSTHLPPEPGTDYTLNTPTITPHTKQANQTTISSPLSTKLTPHTEATTEISGTPSTSSASSPALQLATQPLNSEEGHCSLPSLSSATATSSLGLLSHRPAVSLSTKVSQPCSTAGPPAVHLGVLAATAGSQTQCADIPKSNGGGSYQAQNREGLCFSNSIGLLSSTSPSPAAALSSTSTNNGSNTVGAGAVVASHPQQHQLLNQQQQQQQQQHLRQHAQQHQDTKLPQKHHTSLLSQLGSMSASEMYARLEQVDPETASRQHPNNTRKVLRALQVYYETGRTLSSLLEEQHQGRQGAKSGPLRYADPCILWVKCQQPELDRRLDARVDTMLERGLVAELEDFYGKAQALQAKEEGGPDEKGYVYPHGILQMLGFKEFTDYLGLEPDLRTSEQGQNLFNKGVDDLKQATRRYAKQQVRWITNRFCARPGPSVPPVYAVDSTDLETWDQAVAQALEVVKAYTKGEAPNQAPEPTQRKVDSSVVRQVCDVCGGRVFLHQHEWTGHLKSKKHRHNVRLARERVELSAILTTRETQLKRCQTGELQEGQRGGGGGGEPMAVCQPHSDDLGSRASDLEGGTRDAGVSKPSHQSSS